MPPPFSDRAASTDPTAVERGRPVGELTRRTTVDLILLCLALMVLCPGGLILVGNLVPFRSTMTFAVGCLLVLALLGTALRMGWGWLRPRRTSRLLDVVPVLCLVIGAAVMLWMSQGIGGAYRIQGSALPRVLHGVRHGIPLMLDLLYLAFVGLSLLTLAVLLLTALALLLHSRPVRTLLGRAREQAEELTDPDRETVMGVRPPPSIRTWESQRYLRRHISPSAWVLLVLGSVTSVVCLLVFTLAAPSPDTSELLTIVAAYAPLPGTLVAVLSSLWRRDEGLGITMAALHRTVTVPVLATACFLPSALVSLIPPVSSRFSAHHLAAIGEDGLVGAGSPPIAFVGMAALACMGLGLVGALGVSVFVVMPVVAIFWPDLAIRGNQLSKNPAHRRANIRASRAMAALVVAIFVFSALIVDAEPEDARFWVAMVLVAVMIGLTFFILKTQRADHAARRRSGTAARFQNPADPDPNSDPDPDPHA